MNRITISLENSNSEHNFESIQFAILQQLYFIKTQYTTRYISHIDITTELGFTKRHVSSNISSLAHLFS